jgi:outer membrane protein assembly factor BamB
LSREGHVFCFDAQNGRVRWSKHLNDDYRMSPPQWGFAGSPVSYGDTLLFNAGRSGIALRKRDGEVVWSSERERGSYAAPVLYRYSGGTAAVIFGENAVYGVAADTGNRLWSYRWTTSASVHAADPLVDNGKVFVASAYNQGSALIDISGNRPVTVWTSPIFNTHFSSFVLIDGTIYGNDGDARRSTGGEFRAMDFLTGEDLWSERFGFGSLIAVGSHLVTLDYRGTIRIMKADPRAPAVVSSGELPRGQFWTPPAYSDGFLYCRDTRGNLHRVDLR